MNRIAGGVALAMAAVLALASAASASQLIYKPVNPSFGGDPNNGNWLLSQASAQSGAANGGGSPGFTIDFPDFGNITQPTTPTDPTNLPPNDGSDSNNNGN